MTESVKKEKPAEDEAAEYKEKGNESFKNKKYEEAILYYTHAIKLDSTNYALYSNRSSAFLNLEQYYLALEDAKETIRLQPRWAKGYFRKGEVEYKTFNFFDALLSYQSALVLQPGDSSIEAAIEKTKLSIRTEKRADEQIPWLGAGIGIILGVTIVIADNVLAVKPSLVHPIAMVLLTITVALLGYAGCRAYRSYVRNQRFSLLDPPIDLLEEMNQKENSDDGQTNEKIRPRYSKAQARHRFKRGKT